jgi:transposase
VLEGILWILRTGACWKDLPKRYPSPSTCWRRLWLWEDEGVCLDVWRKFLAGLDEKSVLDWEEAFIDGSFPRQKKGPWVWKNQKGQRIEVGGVVDGQGIPLGSTITSASPHKITLVDAVMAEIKVTRDGPGRPRTRPKRMIADRAHDSDELRDKFKKRQIELICPHRKNRKKPKRQDGQKLRRYRRCWIVEQTFSWIENYRQLLVRHENLLSVYWDSFISRAS